jgi:endoglucanase
MTKPLLVLALPLAAMSFAACGSTTGGSDSGGNQPSGGATSNGGQNGSGGAQSTGGSRETGGRGSGGASATGGTFGTGGNSATGGTSSFGGIAAGGGSTSSGGTVATGGITTGGTTSRGGSSGGGGQATGGNTSSGGASGTGGGVTGQLTPQDAVKLMAPGWNLGNSFDATPNETSWGNPTPSQTLIKAVHAAGFKLLRLAVGWCNHVGGAPSYTIDSAWMNKVKQTAQWAIDDGMYVFLNTHHDSDGGSSGGCLTFPSSTSAAQTITDEVTAIWTQIANTFKSFDSRLMLECFNEPNYTVGPNAGALTDLNMYLEACHKAIRGTGGANSTRIIMIQPIGASPIQASIQSIQKVSFIKSDPNLVFSLHTYYPTNFGLGNTPYAWGSAQDYTSMQNSIAQQIRVWLPTQVIFVGEWGSMGVQPASNRVAHAQAYSQDTSTAGIVPIWWDNGGSGSGSFALFNRSSGAVTQQAIVSAIMTGVKNGLAAPNSWAKP